MAIVKKAPAKVRATKPSTGSSKTSRAGQPNSAAKAKRIERKSSSKKTSNTAKPAKVARATKVARPAKSIQPVKAMKTAKSTKTVAPAKAVPTVTSTKIASITTKKAKKATSNDPAILSASMKSTVLQVLDERQAEEITVIDSGVENMVADCIVIASGRSSRHVCSTADYLLKALTPIAPNRVTVEGLTKGDWVLVDAGDVIIHLFRPDVRKYYDLDSLLSSRPGVETEIIPPAKAPRRSTMVNIAIDEDDEDEDDDNV